MTITIAKYLLWALLCVPLLALGLFLIHDMVHTVWLENKAKQDRRREAQRKINRRIQFEDEYSRTHNGGYDI